MKKRWHLMIKRIGGACLAAAVLLITVLGVCVEIHADAMMISESVSGDIVENAESAESVENIEGNSATGTESTEAGAVNTVTGSETATEEDGNLMKVVGNTAEHPATGTPFGGRKSGRFAPAGQRNFEFDAQRIGKTQEQPGGQAFADNGRYCPAQRQRGGL